MANTTEIGRGLTPRQSIALHNGARHMKKPGNFPLNTNVLPYAGILIVAIVLADIGHQKYGCLSNKPQTGPYVIAPEILPPDYCARIKTSPDPESKSDTSVPGLAYISVNPNTPSGSHTRGGGAWMPQGTTEPVLGFELVSPNDPNCQMALVTSLDFKVDPEVSKFVIGQSFALFGSLGGHDVAMGHGTVASDGTIHVTPLGGPIELKGHMHYFALTLDTSKAQPGDRLAVTSGTITYRVGDKEFTSYQRPYTPPPLEY